MGCIQSSTSDIINSNNDVEMEIGTNHIVKVACITKKNFYPKKPDKPNQDAFCKTRFSAPDGSKVDFFGVFDGHGEQGHKIAQYIAKKLPIVTQKEFKKIDLSSGPMDIQQVEKACLDAHITCNESLKNAYDDETERNQDGSQKKLDCALSGTTSIIMVVWNGGMTICNVGDSRAIIGEVSQPQKQIRARALSRDQIPIRKDERDRVKACGCRVLTLSQAYNDDEEENEEENEKQWTAAYEEHLNNHNHNTTTNNSDTERIYFEDPPRLFSPKGLYPGYQFTRSFGDFIGTDIGIIAEPEISTISMKNSTRMIILATDGVFEYLTDQDVIDVCALFPSPKDACEAVSELAYKNWIDKDVRADDITMLCIYSNINDPLSMSTSIRKNNSNNSTSLVEQQKQQNPGPIIRDNKSGLPDFTNLTAECVKEYIKTGKLTNKDFSDGPSKLKSSESMIFDQNNNDGDSDDTLNNSSNNKVNSPFHNGIMVEDNQKIEQQQQQRAANSKDEKTSKKRIVADGGDDLDEEGLNSSLYKGMSAKRIIQLEQTNKRTESAGGNQILDEGFNSSLHCGVSAKDIEKIEGGDRISDEGFNSSLHCGMSAKDIKEMERISKQQQQQHIGGGGGPVVCTE